MPAEAKLHANVESQKFRELTALAVELYEKGSYEPAEKYLKEALAGDPFFAPAAFLLGKCYLMRGTIDKNADLLESARTLFQLTLNLEPGHTQARLLLDLFGANERAK